MASSSYRALLERLRQLRRDAGLTQERFAEKAGLSAKYYQLLESGQQRDVRFSTLEKIAAAHEMPMAGLFSDGGRHRFFTRES
jgi:transcriptional regulator with XRE-family HTH domain